MGLLIPDTGLLFWMLLSFGIVLAVLVRWGFPVILRAVDARREHIASSLEKAAEAERKTAELHARADGILDQAQKDGGAVIAGAHKEGEAIIERARQAAREQAARSTEAAQAEAAEIKRRALDDAMGQIAALSVKIAGKVLEEDLRGDERQQKLIEKLLKEETSGQPTAKQ